MNSNKTLENKIEDLTQQLINMANERLKNENGWLRREIAKKKEQ